MFLSVILGALCAAVLMEWLVFNRIGSPRMTVVGVRLEWSVLSLGRGGSRGGARDDGGGCGDLVGNRTGVN